MTNYGCVAHVKVEHEPVVSMCPTSIIPTKVMVNNCLLGYTSSDYGQGVEEELLWVNSVAILGINYRLKGVGPNQQLHLMVRMDKIT